MTMKRGRSGHRFFTEGENRGIEGEGSIEDTNKTEEFRLAASEKAKQLEFGDQKDLTQWVRVLQQKKGGS